MAAMRGLHSLEGFSGFGGRERRGGKRERPRCCGSLFDSSAPGFGGEGKLGFPAYPGLCRCRGHREGGGGGRGKKNEKDRSYDKLFGYVE